jgi:alanyl-tRNA synthetase
MMNTNIWSNEAESVPSYCTEIYFDTEKEEEFDDKYLELYNLVLMNTNGYKSIDTGLSVERLCRVMQNVEDDFLIHIYKAALNYILLISSKKRTQPPLSLSQVKTLLNHNRTILYLIKEGLLPDKKGKGYVITKLIRRCLRVLQLNQVPEEELFHICTQLCDDDISIPLNLEAIINIKQEISKFQSLLTKGLKHISNNSTSISKENMFKLYDTYGVPYDFIEEIALKQGITCEDFIL